MEAKFIHSHHLTCSSYFIKKLQNKRLRETRILFLEETCPSASYVATTFHPTIVQCAHQSLSNTTTPELGMISTRNIEHQQAHIQPRIQQKSSKTTRLGLLGYKQTSQYTARFIKIINQANIHIKDQPSQLINGFIKLQRRSKY